VTGVVQIVTRLIQLRLTASVITRMLPRKNPCFVINVVNTKLFSERTPAKEALETNAKSATL